MAPLLLGAQSPTARAKDLYTRALELDRRGNSAAALSLLWEAAGVAPGDGLIQDQLGQALERIGALDAAVDAYRLAAAAPAAPRAAANHLLVALVKAGRAPEAIELARVSAERTPNDPETWFRLGLAQADVDVAGAIDSFRRALTLDPKHALASYNLGLVLYRVDRIGPALDALHRALEIQPRAEVHYTLGVVYSHQGDLERAARSLSEAIAGDPGYADAYLALGSVLEARGDPARAAVALRRAVALRPDVAAPHIVLAQALARTGDEAGAGRELAEADRLRSAAQQAQAAATLTAAGAEKLDAGDAAAAADCFRRAIGAFDAFAPAHYQLGRALERLGQHDAAGAAFARAQQLNPALVPPVK